MPFKIKKTVSSLAPSGNSVLFNGTNQYLSIPNNAAFQLGTGDFTAECWTYATSMPQSFARLLSVAGTYGGSNVGLEINISTSAAPINSIEFTINGNNTTYFRISTNSAISINTWYHVAVTRLSGTIYCFLNGVLQTSSTSGASTNINGSGGATIAAAIGGGAYWPGYVSNVRILKGTALYTASFTAPTAPLTTISSCSLLTCQSPTIVDNSGNNFAITNNNAATVSSTFTPFSSSLSPFKVKKRNPNPTMLTGYGASFDGTNNIQTPSNAAFGFGTGDWTIEGWFRASTSTAMKLWRFSDNSDNLDFDLGFSTFGGLGYYNGSSSTYSSAGIITSSIWYHIAAVRKSGTASVYLNGVSVLSQTSTTNSSARSLNVGSAAGSTFNGYISNFRVLKGTALYSASFVPPTSPITSNTSCSLLTCNAVTIIDGSSNAFTLTNNGNTVIPSSSFTPFSSSLIAPTNYSVAFNGSNQYLSLPNTSALDLGSNNFTMEAWVYPASISGNKNIFYINGNASSYSAICLYVQDSQFAFLANQTGGYPWTLQIGAVGPAISSNTWYHVAATRSGNSFYVFVNGTLVSGAPYTLSGALYNGTTNIIGYQPTVASYFNGYISNARIINGTALYTASFTPLNSPLTAITNTKLLTCNAATIVDSSTNNLTLTNTGAATVSSTITPFSASVSNSGFKLKQVSYVRPAYDFTISPAYSGKSTWDLTIDGPLTLTGSGAWTIAPITNFNTTVKMWGAGGARGYSYRDSITSTNDQGAGGAGGYSTANIAIQNGNSYIVQVGQGGIRTNTASSGATYLAGGVQGSYGGTQGGGYSGIFITSVSQANALLMAGGGGGGGQGGFSSNAGAGGGSSGQDSAGSNQGGGGGSQSAGGGAAAYNSPTVGSALTGGLGKTASGEASLGGGGGGYWGGGGGNVGGGGGGSGRIGTNASVTSGTTTAGAADVPGNSSDADRGGAGRGGNATSNSGADGKIIITKI
jgi:hypothetical protein